MATRTWAVCQNIINGTEGSLSRRLDYRPCGCIVLDNEPLGYAMHDPLTSLAIPLQPSDDDMLKLKCLPARSADVLFL